MFLREHPKLGCAATGVVMLVGLAAIVADAPKLALGFIFANP